MSERAVAPPSGLALALTIDPLDREGPMRIMLLAEQVGSTPRASVLDLADPPASVSISLTLPPVSRSSLTLLAASASPRQRGETRVRDIHLTGVG
jgi:hypothetical protein